MDKDTDMDMPTVDGIPIPPYEPLSYPPSPPLTDKDVQNGLILAISLPVVVVILFFLFVLAGRLGLW